MSLRNDWLGVASVLLVLLSPLLPPLCGRVVAGEAPRPEDYLASGEYSQYVEATEQWLEASPDAPSAPRVALDLLVAATVTGDDATVRKMQKLLVLNYPASTSGQYVVLQIPDADDFSALMSDIADDNALSPPMDFPARYDAAIRVGSARFGPAALGTGPRVLRTALIARAARDDDMERFCLDRLQQESATGCLKVFSIVTDPALSAGERLEELHGFGDRALALPFENFVLAKMSPGERQATDVLVIEADDELDSGRISEALPLLDRIPAEAQDPRLVFWRGCAWAAAGDSATAVDLFSKLEAGHPGNPWARQGAEMAPVIQNLDASRTATVDGLLAAARGLGEKWDQFQGRATFVNSRGVRIDVYVAVVRGGRFDLYIAEGGKTVVAYESTAAGSALLSAGQKAYETSDRGGVVPIPALTIYRLGEGFSFDVSVNMGLSADEVADGISSLVASRYLSTRDGMEDLISSNQRRGIFPASPARGRDGSATYTFMMPRVHQAACSLVQFIVGSDGTLRGIRGDGFSISDLRYGPAGSFPIDGLPLSPAEHASNQKLDPATLRQLLPVVVALFDPPDEAPASQPSR